MWGGGGRSERERERERERDIYIYIYGDGLAYSGPLVLWIVVEEVVTVDEGTGHCSNVPNPESVHVIVSVPQAMHSPVQHTVERNVLPILGVTNGNNLMETL